MSETLWAVEVVGPDDWYAVRSLQDAREFAQELNTAIMRRPADDIEPNVWAVPRAVTWTKEQHDASLADQDRERAVQLRERAR